MSNTPFLGVYRTKGGDLVDMFNGQTVTPDQIKPNMAPFYGVFLDKDGNEHDLSEFLGSVGGGGPSKAHVDGGTLVL